MTTENDLVYTKAGDAELKLDLARPAEGDGPFPAVLVIHGGGWRAGNKEDIRGRAGASSPAGATWRSRRSTGSAPRTTFPAQVHDVKAAVRWLKAHAEGLQGRPRPHRRDRASRPAGTCR